MQSLVHATDTIHLYAISERVQEALSGLDARGWSSFLVAVAVLEGSLASDRPPGRIVRATEEGAGRLFVLDLTALRSNLQLICARNGRQILIAEVVPSRRRVGQAEVESAQAELRKWRRWRKRQSAGGPVV